MILAIHIAAAGLWLGCILVEVFFERALAESPANRNLLAGLHKKVDYFVEIPAFAVVLTTGVILFAAATKTPALYAMTGFGILAVIANVICVIQVVGRDLAARADDETGFKKLDHAQHKVGAVVLLSVIAALLAGFWHALIV